MRAFLARLNPAERRFVMIVGLVFFAIVNYFWVWPHFSDWSDLKGRLSDARRKHTDYEVVIRRADKLKPEMTRLRNEGGDVPPEEQQFQFLQTIQSQVGRSGINFVRNSSPRTSTNMFFLDQSQTISVQGGEKQLVDFLYNLGAGNSLIRVRSLSVRPDPARQQLSADITLIASYQKNKARAAAAAAAAQKPTAPAAKPTTPGAAPTPSPGSGPVKPLPTSKPKPTDPRAGSPKNK